MDIRQIIKISNDDKLKKKIKPSGKSLGRNLAPVPALYVTLALKSALSAHSGGLLQVSGLRTQEPRWVPPRSRTCRTPGSGSPWLSRPAAHHLAGTAPRLETKFYGSMLLHSVPGWKERKRTICVISKAGSKSHQQDPSL